MKLSSPIYQLKHRAKSMAREEGIPLHKAQDRIAQMEGFATWSLLSSKAATSLVTDVLGQVESGDLVLLAARPGHGKTIVGLQALLDARRENRRSFFFTLDMTENEARDRLTDMSNLELAKSIDVETSDEIDADFIIAALAEAAPRTIAVVDYLQLLDACRDKPELAEQIDKLRLFAASKQIVLIFLSQIDRSFDPTQRKMPSLADIRLPNPVPIEAFDRRFYLHDGEMRVEHRAA
ncbi:DNA helicase [Erythrobacter ani]|uniref:SF4 helicase domain-containing protein n=1 Tax=Erythrobacter ani TaxID=2827235 RepID=A0ABS6SRA3_9SPHN|nr:DNA helicase [Erythrobacter ani]MBV7267545.1 hypothetical protein [Erythrobacter ani]